MSDRSAPSFCDFPYEWLTRLKKDNGTSHLLAVVILSEIKYHYNKRPDGGFYFTGDAFRISYDELSEHTGQPKSAVKSAVMFLEEKGYIRREFRTVEIGGVKHSNIMYILLGEAFDTLLSGESECEDASSEKMTGVCQNFDIAMGDSTQYLDNTGENIENINNIYRLSVIGKTDGRTETSEHPSLSLSASDDDSLETVSDIERRIDADGIKADSPCDADRVDSIVSLIRSIESDDAVSCRDKEVVRSLTRRHVEAVLVGVRERCRGSVRSPEHYLRACLLNSVNTAGFSFEPRGMGGGPVSKARKGVNFPERHYDFDELEKKLLSVP